MTTFLRALRTIALACWFGSGIFFVVVTAIAFRSLPDAHTAGALVRASLTALHQIGFVAGLLYLVLTLALLATQRDSHPVRAIELVLTVIMLAVTAYSQLSVMPRMDADRMALGGNVDASPAAAPAHRNFDRLHKLSVRLESTVLLAALALLSVAPIHGREDFDRFA